MAKPEYTEPERKLIGIKLKYLMKDQITQTDMGVQAFGKAKQAGQAYIKRILAGDVRKIERNDIIKMLDLLGIDYSKFVEMEDPESQEDVNYIVNGQVVPKEFLELWPSAPKYFRMLKDAQDEGDEELELAIKKQMAKSLRKQAAIYQESAEQEEREALMKKA